MAQPVQHQQHIELPRNPSTVPPEVHIQDELFSLYHRSDALLRELTIVRRRMDELHAVVEEGTRGIFHLPTRDERLTA